MAGRAAGRRAGDGVPRHAQQRRGAFARGQQVLRRHGHTAAAHTVHRQAEFVVERQRAVAVARRKAPGQVTALRGQLFALLTLPGVADLFEQGGSQRVGAGGQRDVGQFQAAQQGIHAAAQRRGQQQHIAAALQVARQVAAGVLQRQRRARQQPPHRARHSGTAHLLFGAVQQRRGARVRLPARRAQKAQRHGAVQRRGQFAPHYSRSRMPS